MSGIVPVGGRCTIASLSLRVVPTDGCRVRSPRTAVAAWFTQPARAVDVAVLRIVVFLLLAHAVWSSEPWAYAAIDDALLVPARLLGGLVVDLPRSHDVLVVASAATIGLALVAATGRAVRAAGLAAVLLAVWVLGVTVSYGKVDHIHHVLWLAAVLAMGSSDRALVLGRRTDGRATAAVHGATLRVCWLLVGACYFFPGLAKLAVGPDWFSGRRLEAIQQATTIQKSFTPLFELHGFLAAAAAIATVAFELCFVLAVATRWRRWAFAAAIAFHLGTAALMDIAFPSLLLVLLAFTYGAGDHGDDQEHDGAGVVERARPEPGLRRLAVVALPLLVAVVLTGAGRMLDGWPVAQYPPFDYVPGQRVNTVVAVIDEPGGCRELELHRDLDVVPVSQRQAILRNTVRWPTDARLDAVTELVPGEPVIGLVHRTMTLDGEPVQDEVLRGVAGCPDPGSP